MALNIAKMKQFAIMTWRCKKNIRNLDFLAMKDLRNLADTDSNGQTILYLTQNNSIHINVYVPILIILK